MGRWSWACGPISQDRHPRPTLGQTGHILIWYHVVIMLEGFNFVYGGNLTILSMEAHSTVLFRGFVHATLFFYHERAEIQRWRAVKHVNIHIIVVHMFVMLNHFQETNAFPLVGIPLLFGL